LTTRGGITVLIDSTLSGNTGGSAAYMWDVWGYGGFTLLLDTTVSGNEGAGLRNYYGRLTLASSTVSGNGFGSSGGGVSTGLYSYTYIEQTTIAGNYGVGLYNSGSTEITGSIVTGSSTSDCDGDTNVSGANNFDGDDSCPGFGLLTGFDPVLADNGGPTQTHAILEGSSAIDAAGVCGINRDQRGEPRNGECDSGSFELQGEPLEGISGTAAGLSSLAGTCANQTAGGFIEIPQQIDGAYSCEGLAAGTGDTVIVKVRGPAQQTAVRGNVEGMVLFRVVCRNLTTGQRVAAVRNSTQWHCSSAGFTAGAGDRVLLEIKGSSL
jgi:hypothetical protein